MSVKSLQVAVVGTGLAGLTAANQLSRSGRPLTISLFEKSNRLGGRASTTIKQGFHLNLGAHALYKGGKTLAYLRALGITVSGANPVQTNAQILAGGKLYSMPLDAVGTMSTNLLTLSEKLEWTQLMAGLAEIDSVELDSVTLTDWLYSVTNSTRIRELLLSLVRLGTFANCPDLISAGAALRQLVLGFGGVLYLDGGWQSIVDSLRAQLPDTVVEHLNNSVESISLSPSGRIAITCDSGLFEFDHVVLALPPQQVHHLLPDALPQSLLSSFVPARIACLDVCLSHLPERQNSFAIGLDCPLYYSVHSLAAHLTENNDQALIHLGYYLAVQEKAGEHVLSAMTDLLDRMQPGWQQHLVYKRFLPEMVASYSVPLASRAGSNGLPDVDLSVDSSARIVACGDWVSDNAQIADAAVSSGIKAADAILKATSRTAAL